MAENENINKDFQKKNVGQQNQPGVEENESLTEDQDLESQSQSPSREGIKGARKQ